MLNDEKVSEKSAKYFESMNNCANCRERMLKVCATCWENTRMQKKVLERTRKYRKVQKVQESVRWECLRKVTKSW